MDVATLARRNIVSTVQVRQLEDGGQSSFYSPEIKFSVGKKLLKYLGHDLKVEGLNEQPITLSTELTQTEATSLASVHSEKWVSPSEENLASRPATKTTSAIFPVLISTSVVFVALWFWLGKEHDSPPVVSTDASTAEKPTTPANAADKPDSLQTTPSSNELAKTDFQTACRWSKDEEEIQPESPRKAGDYVHVVAQQAMTVCIMDGQKRVATLNLQVGEARSIYGPSPFWVSSSDLSGVKVYFQGQQIRPTNQDGHQIKLTAAPYIALNN